MKECLTFQKLCSVLQLQSTCGGSASHSGHQRDSGSRIEAMLPWHWHRLDNFFQKILRSYCSTIEKKSFVGRAQVCPRVCVYTCPCAHTYVCIRVHLWTSTPPRAVSLGGQSYSSSAFSVVPEWQRQGQEPRGWECRVPSVVPATEIHKAELKDNDVSH